MLDSTLQIDGHGSGLHVFSGGYENVLQSMRLLAIPTKKKD